MIAGLQLPVGGLAGSVDKEGIVVGVRYKIDSVSLGESREIMVSVPEDRNRPYPVIYVLNAEAEFLPTVAAVRQLASNSNEMPDLIVVGVVPIDGAKETRPNFPQDGRKNEHEQRFRQFVAHELVTHIDATYDTHPYRILAGHSLSGLFTLNTFRRDADSFNAYFAFSPALWWDNGKEADAIQQSLTTRKTAAKTVAITIANEGAESLGTHRDFVAGLANVIPTTITLMDAEFPEETHSSTTLPATYWALQQLFAGWRPDADQYQQGLTGLEQHYRELSTRFGWEIPIPLDDLSSLVFDFARRGKAGDDLRVYELIHYVLEREPSMGGEFIEIMGALKTQGHVNGAATVEQALCNSDPPLSICDRLPLDQ